MHYLQLGMCISTCFLQCPKQIALIDLSDCSEHVLFRAAIGDMASLRQLVAGTPKAVKSDTYALHQFLNVQNQLRVPKEIVQKLVECHGVEVAMLLDRTSFANNDFLSDAGFLDGQLWHLEQIRLRVESGGATSRKRKCGVQCDVACAACG